MIFPDVERVLYQKKPLLKVICQVRFPAILLIDKEPPADLQEKIRDIYPVFRETRGHLEIPLELTEVIPPEVAKIFQARIKAYEFASENNLWIFSLTKDFLALSSDDYERWERFSERFLEVFAFFQDIYRPSYIARIGLRYQNMIVRSNLGLDDVPWSELLNPHIAGELASQSPQLNELIGEIIKVVRIDLPDIGGFARLRHGLANNNETQEQCYFLDSDFFVETKKEITDAADILKSLNHYNRLFFRWCIGDRLHNAMEPQSI